MINPIWSCAPILFWNAQLSLLAVYCQKKWLDQEPEGLETFSVDGDDLFSYPNILFFVFLERMQV